MTPNTTPDTAPDHPRTLRPNTISHTLATKVERCGPWGQRVLLSAILDGE